MEQENKKKILVFCKHPEILETMLRLIHQRSQWQAVGHVGAEEGEPSYPPALRLVILGSGLSEGEEQEIHSFYLQQNPSTLFLQHFGGGSGLLFNEIDSAFGGNPNGNFELKKNSIE